MADIYSALMGDAPSTPEQMQALAQALRQQKVLGQMGVLTGDPVMGTLGKNLETGADTSAKEIGDVRAKNISAQQLKDYQAAQIKNWAEERDISKATLTETIRRDTMENEARMAALGFGPGGKGNLESLSPANQALVDDIGNMRAPPLNAGTTRNQNNKMIMAAVYEKYPEYTADRWKNLQDTVDKFGGGGGAQSPGAALRQANSAVQHMDRSMQDVKELANSSFVPLNTVFNEIRGVFSSSTLAAFRAKKLAISAEINKFLTASGGALEDRNKFQAALDEAQSPEALQAVVNSFKDMMADQMSSYKAQYRAGTYGKRDDFEDHLSNAVRDQMAARNPDIIPSKGTQKAAEKAVNKVTKPGREGYSAVEVTAETPGQDQGSATPDNPQGRKGRPPNPPMTAADTTPAQ